MARVLLAEDEFLIRLVVAEELAEHGHSVIEAESGDEALRLVESGQACDILVTDIQMPGALDGIGLASCLRHRYPSVPVVYVTGRPESLAGISVFGQHDAVVRKPFAATEIVELVEDIMSHVHHSAASS